MIHRILALFMLAMPISTGVAQETEQTVAQPVNIDLFYEPGCPECERVRTEILPKLEADYSGMFRLNELDLNIESNYFRLAAYLDQYNSHAESRVFLVVDGKRLLAGYAQIAAEVYSVLNDCMLSPSGQTSVEQTTTGHDLTRLGQANVAKRARQFGFYGILLAGLLAGLLDGINPCAIATLVFFISLLLVSKVHGRLLLLAGMAFCVASFVTYFLIGFGLFRALHSLMAFKIIRQIVASAMILTLACLAFLSFRDAFRFCSTQRPDDVTLQLPNFIKNRIRAVMRRELKVHHVVSAALIIGFVITLLESVCTGQVYLPVIVYLVKSGESIERGLAGLVIYNLAFVLPLVIILILIVKGMAFQHLLAWSKTNFVISKTLLGCFFLLMAVLMVLI